MNDDKIWAPWSNEQVDALNQWQESGHHHPFTCGNNSSHGALVATPVGWVCAGRLSCNYSQVWAWAFMADPLAVIDAAPMSVFSLDLVDAATREGIRDEISQATFHAAGEENRLLRAERDAARKEIERMSIVIDAACALYEASVGSSAPRTSLFAKFLNSVENYRHPIIAQVHEPTIVPRPKMDSSNLVAVSCSCGQYLSSPGTEATAMKDWRQHAVAKTEPESVFDWTAGPDGRSNTSEKFVRLVKEVERLIRADAFKLIAGKADDTALLIMSQLAHNHEVGPANSKWNVGYSDNTDPTSSTDFAMAIQAALTEAERKLVATPVDGEEVTLGDHVRAAVRVSAPVIRRNVLLRLAREFMTEASLHTTEEEWDRGFAAGLDRAAAKIANEVSRTKY